MGDVEMWLIREEGWTLLVLGAALCGNLMRGSGRGIASVHVRIVVLMWMGLQR
jgi:hypothetical protein